jgi:probable HAF family extracellular repeat protein
MEKKGNTNLKPKKERQKMKKLPLFLIGLIASLAIGVSTTRAQVMYSLEDLGIVKGMEASEAAALNNLGHVAGTAYSGQETCAFHYDYLKRFMDDAGGINSRGFGINHMGLIVGDSFFTPAMEPRSHAAMFKGGYVVDLGVLKGQVYSRANGINAMGQVVGYSGLTRDSSQSRAFLWSNQTGMIDIGTLGGAYAQANAINDTGFITGTSQLPATAGPLATEITHAFSYCQACLGLGRQMRDLGVLGGNSSYGMAINNYNHVAGYSTIKANDDRVHAFFHDGNKMIDLGSLGASRWGSDLSVALGINKLDQVVGYTYMPAVGEMPIQQVAFLWRRGMNGSGQMINLNALLYGAGKDYLVFSATAINDNGQIVGTAYYMPTGDVRAVMLTPEGPAPARTR